MTRCCCCGQLIPPPAEVFQNARVKQRIYEYIAAHPEGVSRRQVVEAVYADDPDGGPEYMNVIAVHVKQMNPKLATLGVRLVASGGPHSVYRLVAL